MRSLSFVVILLLALWRRSSAQALCQVDDYLTDVILSEDQTGRFQFPTVLRLDGPCSDVSRVNVFILYDPRPRSPPRLAPTTQGDSLDVLFNPTSSPYCIAATISTPMRENNFLLNLYYSNENIVGFVRIGPTSLSLNFGAAQAVTFSISGRLPAADALGPLEYSHIQICVTRSEAILYINCKEIERRAYAGIPSISLTTFLTLLQSSLINSTNRFTGRVAQLYSAQCQSSVTMQELVNVQCNAFPLNCSRPSLLNRSRGIEKVINSQFRPVPDYQHHTRSSTSSQPTTPTTTESASTTNIIIGFTVAFLLLLLLLLGIVTILVFVNEKKKTPKKPQK